MNDFLAWMGERQAHIETALAETLPTANHAPARLHDAMRYAVLGGGKRVRPLLALPPANSPTPIPRASCAPPSRSS